MLAPSVSGSTGAACSILPLPPLRPEVDVPAASEPPETMRLSEHYLNATPWLKVKVAAKALSTTLGKGTTFSWSRLVYYRVHGHLHGQNLALCHFKVFVNLIRRDTD